MPEHIQEYLFGNPAEKMQGALDLMNYQQGQAAGLLKKMVRLKKKFIFSDAKTSLDRPI